MTRFYRFLFTRSEIRGMLALGMAVIVIRVLATSLAPLYGPVPGTDPAGPASDSSGQVRKRPPIVEINSADSVALVGLPGIGPVFARRIVQYRAKLGGFYDPGQLLEVYGMDSTRLAGMSDRMRIDTSGIRKLDINQATFKELLAHPYLEYEHVKAVARYRDRKGRIRSPGDLWASGVLPDSLRVKLLPYLVSGPDSVKVGKEGLHK